MKNKSLLKKVGQGLLILIIAVLTYKFIRWNWWKLDQAATLARGIINSPAAVNLTLSKKSSGSTLYRKSFAHNPHGNYYLINQFDITPYIDDNDTLNVTLAINDRDTQSLLLYRFKTYNIIACKDQYFVFTTPGCGIEAFVELKKSLPTIIDSLDKGKSEWKNR